MRKTRAEEAAHWMAVRHLMHVAAWGGPVHARKPEHYWHEVPEGVTQDEWNALVDAEVAPFVGGRVFVHGDKLVPEPREARREQEAA